MTSPNSDQWRQDREFHESLFDEASDGAGGSHSRSLNPKEVQNAPLFTAKVLEHAGGKYSTPSSHDGFGLSKKGTCGC